ncbi:MAG: DUF2892 domain-containing protein [Armatimonadetes bacterium]|nr:DUF2892 domain-containing protein [Armatimonadota bacterium]
MGTWTGANGRSVASAGIGFGPRGLSLDMQTVTPLSVDSPTIARPSRRIERQTHFVAGLLLVTSVVLAASVDPRWSFLALLPAFGMFLDAATGFCPMSAFLRHMPWNRERP